MRYALVPRAGDWRDAGVFRDGWEFNHPLICHNVTPHPGSLPGRWGLLEVSNPNVVVSSLKPTRDGEIALRLYEASGRPAPGVTITLRANVRSARDANLLEDAGADVKTAGNSVQIDLTPFEIKTIRLRLDTLP
jgi:alpha-mannosidase